MANQLTQEQTTIIEAYKNPENASKNFLINARAGSGKTFTAVKMSQFSPEGSRFLAFNKTIATELESRILTAKCQTINAFGHELCRTNLRTFKVNTSKYKFILEDQLKATPLSNKAKFKQGQQKAALEIIDDYRANMGLIPMKQLVQIKGFSDDQLNEVTNLLSDCIEIGCSKTSTVDFMDQLWLPVFHQNKINWQRLGITDLFVDEVQDLTPIQFELIKLTNAKRFIFIGDPYQAIYGFAGATTDAFHQIEKTFNAINFPLTECFRVPNNILAEARKFCPDIHSTFELENKSPEPSDKVTPRARLFRNNASLIGYFLSLSPEVQNDCVVRCTPKFWHVIYQAMNFEDRKLANETNESNQTGSSFNSTQLPSLETLSQLKQTDEVKLVALLLPLAQAEGKAANWFQVGTFITDYFYALKQKTSGFLTLSTIHQAKGLEWDHVSVELTELTQEELEDSQSQEVNLIIIALTRSRKSLDVTWVEAENTEDDPLERINHTQHQLNK